VNVSQESDPELFFGLRVRCERAYFEHQVLIILRVVVITLYVDF
jgi:hypothetical protein